MDREWTLGSCEKDFSKVDGVMLVSRKVPPTCVNEIRGQGPGKVRRDVGNLRKYGVTVHVKQSRLTV